MHTLYHLRAISRHATGVCVVVTLTLGCCIKSQAAEFFVSSALQIANAMQSAQPGDSIIMANGNWTNQSISFAGFGTSANPITLRAETPGQVVLNGASKLSISGDWLVADGLRFEGGALSSGNVVEFRGSNGPATNSRFTNSAIVNYNPADISTRYFWVSMYGQSNRVDHNSFIGQNHSGVTVTVWRDSPAADYHQIDNNYFGDRPVGNDNGWETIRIGDSSESLSSSYTLVENNLFERTDGEIEIISNKSGNNTFRYNTFREAAGTLTLRHGDDNRVEGNFFLGEGKSQTGGVRVIGERQTLVNNYFQGLDGRADGAISISAGVPNSALNGYYQVKDAMIAHNTIIDVNKAAITFDHDFSNGNQNLLAQNVTIANNLIWSTQDPLFDGAEGSGWAWEGNIAYGQSLGPVAGNPGITVVNPGLSQSPDGLYRLGATSPAIDAGGSGYSGLIGDDMDGQPRIGMYDVGADEFSTSTIMRVPLSKNDVGPNWLGGPIDPPGGGGGGGGGCGPMGCAIQAENVTAILDPDNDGNRWAVASVSGALGGDVLRAPSGDRVDLGSEAHDTIATYAIRFETVGVYRAYYRGRGFDGSSDSFYTPDDFDADPDNNSGLNSDGQFQWRKDSRTFTITQSHVGVPLEFRIGMREGLAEFDAFVLHLSGTLSDTALDDLFTVLAGDFNADGVVDAGDYTVWRESLGQTGSGLAADGDGNGRVDEADYAVWRTNYGAVLLSGLATPSSSAAPEPASMVLLLGIVTILAGGRLTRVRASGAPLQYNLNASFSALQKGSSRNG